MININNNDNHNNNHNDNHNDNHNKEEHAIIIPVTTPLPVVIHIEDDDEINLPHIVENLNPNTKLNPIVLWFIFLLSIIFYGVGLFIIYIPSKLYNIDVPNYYMIISFGRLLGNIIILFTIKHNLKNFKNSFKQENLKAKFFTFISPFTSTLGYYTYEILIRRGQSVSLMSALTNLYILFPILYGIFFLKDEMNYKKYIGFSILTISIILVGLAQNSGNAISHNKVEFVDIILIILAIVFWGMSVVVRIYSLQRLLYSNFIYISIVGQIINFLFSLIQLKTIENITNDIMTPWIFVLIFGQMTAYLGSICSVVISSDSETSKWSALTQTSGLITIILSIIFYHEPITPLLISGFVLLIFSGILISS